MPRRVSVVGWWKMPVSPGAHESLTLEGRPQEPPAPVEPSGDEGSPLGRREASPGPVYPPPGSPPSSCRPLLCPWARTRYNVTVLLTASCRLPCPSCSRTRGHVWPPGCRSPALPRPQPAQGEGGEVGGAGRSRGKGCFSARRLRWTQRRAEGW